MKNHEVAELLRNIAQLLEIKNELIFKIRAYEKAALNINNLEEDIEDVWKKGMKVITIDNGYTMFLIASEKNDSK